MRSRVAILAPIFVTLPWLATMACGGHDAPPPTAPSAVDVPVSSGSDSGRATDPSAAPGASSSPSTAPAPNPHEARDQALKEAASFTMVATYDGGDGTASSAPDTAHGNTSSGPALKSPSMRQGAVQVSGRLPPEVISRIVRQNFGRFRLCYENGLHSKPTLAGKIAVKFVIEPTGDVSTVQDGGSDLPDGNVVSCVVRAFGNLSFPAPESGKVTVVFPILFDSGNPSAVAPKPTTPTKH